MTQYIDKSALVAEIERRVEAIRKAFNEPGILSGVDRTYAYAQYEAFKSLFPYLDTLEVKEVDLQKEVASQYESNYEEYLTYEEFADIAKYFFELGIQHSNHNKNK